MHTISQTKTIDLIPEQKGLLTLTSKNEIKFDAKATLNVGTFEFEMPLTATITSNTDLAFTKEFSFDKTYTKSLFKYTKYTTVITEIGPIILGIGFDVETILTLTGKITAKANLNFYAKKELSYTIKYSDGKFDSVAKNDPPALAPSAKGTIQGDLTIDANLIPSINVFVQGMPVRLRTYINFNAKGGLLINGAADPKVQTACVKGNLDLGLNLIFKFTWMVFPGTGSNSD